MAPVSEPRVTPEGVELRLADPGRRLDAVELWYHLRRPYPDRSFHRDGDGWTYWLPRPEVDRLEYLIDLRGPDGHALVTDPGNPRRAPGAFGEHSVVEFPGYREPWWLAASAAAPSGRRRAWLLPAGRGLRRDLPVQVWSPEGLPDDEVAPLLLVHDGPEMDRYASLTAYSATLTRAGLLPAHRVGLLDPLDRDAWYSGSPGYARSLATTALPALLAQVPTRGRPVLLGASLGALAAFHVEWAHPGTVAGLFLASGSFFQPRLDEQESGHRAFWRVTRTVAEVLDAPQAPSRPPVRLVCGSAEENLANNRSFARALHRLGYPGRLAEFRDGHTWVGWRDTFDPHLTALLAAVWEGSQAH
jgi:enterochelin esterase family protein